MKTLVHRFWSVGVAVAVFVTISSLLLTTTPEKIIDAVGSNNAYLLMFILGLIGGLSTFVGIPYHIVLMSLAAGGISPFLLGSVTAFGVILGDSTMYVIGRGVQPIIPNRLRATITHIGHWLEHHPHFITPGLFIYGACSPFSNDFIVATLSLSGYSYWRTIIPLALGNCVFNITVAYLGRETYTIFINLF